MGKLGDILKKDVGSMATKVFNADVGLMVKSAGRALNTDVGTIAKGAGQVLSYDLADLFVNDSNDPDANTSTNGDDRIVAHVPPTELTGAESVAHNESSTGTSAAPSLASNTQPESTNAPVRAKLTAALVERNSRTMPESSDLNVLLPTTVGLFSRSANAAHGDIASDPVSAIYSSDTEAITITITVYWDADEASAQLQRRQSTLENVRSSTGHTWVAGTDSLGVIFGWTRQHVCYEIVSPRGVSPLARFLADFPH